MTFAEADRIYADLKQQYVAGALTADQFDEQLHALMVQDELGRWWAKSRETGNWHYFDAVTEDWVASEPPVAPAPPAATAPSKQDTRKQEARNQDRTPPQAAQAPRPPQPAPPAGEQTPGAVNPNAVDVSGTQDPAAGQGALPKWAAVAPGAPAANPTAGMPQPLEPGPVVSAETLVPGELAPSPAATAYSVRDFAPVPELSGGLKLVLYLLSLIIPFAGILLFFVYRNKPAQPDRNAARAFLILGVLSLVFTCLCSGMFFLLETVLLGTQPT